MKRALLLAVMVALLSIGCPLVDDGGQATLRVNNYTPFTVVEVNVNNIQDDVWYPNRLERSLGPNSSYDIRGIDPSRYNQAVFHLRAVFADGSFITRMNVPIEPGDIREWTLSLKDGSVKSEISLHELRDGGYSDFSDAYQLEDEEAPTSTGAFE